MQASTDKVRAVSEVVYPHLEVVVGALKKFSIFALCSYKKSSV